MWTGPAWAGAPARGRSSAAALGFRPTEEQEAGSRTHFIRPLLPGFYFFLDTPTVRPRRPVVFVCWPRTRSLGGVERRLEG